ncbi:MAG: SAM-dependent methyltransferase [Gemmatimonadota bacterium]|nr:SAM-dependent methyltransferase [Gemmatimonadota bacterium]
MAAIKLFSIALVLVFFAGSVFADKPQELFFKVFPIGKVKKAGDKTYIELAGEYIPGLAGLDEFSHVTVVYWFDKNDTPEKRSKLLTSRVSHGEPVGVFATHSPVRPNLIAVSHCRILSVEDNRVYINEIDAFDGSPVLDLKCFIPYTYDRKDEVFTLPEWARKVVAKRVKSGGKK